MRTFTWLPVCLAALCACLLFTQPARADEPDLASVETGAALAEPPGGVRPRRAAPLAPRAAADAPWAGPRVELGYAYYLLGDGFGGGSVHAVSFGGYLPTGQLRVGLIGDGGVRDYRLGGADAALRATLVAGWQGIGITEYVVPFVAAVFSFGCVVGQRFATTFVDALLGVGLEIGFEFNPVRTLHLGASLAHVRVDLDGLGYGLWVVRLFTGL